MAAAVKEERLAQARSRTERLLRSHACTHARTRAHAAAGVLGHRLALTTLAAPEPPCVRAAMGELDPPARAILSYYTHAPSNPAPPLPRRAAKTLLIYLQELNPIGHQWLYRYMQVSLGLSLSTARMSSARTPRP